MGLQQQSISLKKGDFKYESLRDVSVSQSIQVYEFNTNKGSLKIRSIIEEFKKDQEDYPKILKISESRGIVSFSMQIWKGEEILHYDVTIKPKENFLIVQGRGDGRRNVNIFLAKIIEDDTIFNVIRDYQLTVKQEEYRLVS